MNDTTNKPANAVSRDSLMPYAAPQLVRYGEVRNLTAGGSGPSAETGLGPMGNLMKQRP